MLTSLHLHCNQAQPENEKPQFWEAAPQENHPGFRLPAKDLSVVSHVPAPSLPLGSELKPCFHVYSLEGSEEDLMVGSQASCAMNAGPLCTGLTWFGTCEVARTGLASQEAWLLKAVGMGPHCQAWVPVVPASLLRLFSWFVPDVSLDGLRFVPHCEPPIGSPCS